MTAQQALQARIDARQDYDAIDYAIRVLGGGPQWQLTEGQRIAERLLGRAISRYDAWEMKRAKKLARERLKEAEAELKGYGTKRQLRLALKEAA